MKIVTWKSTDVLKSLLASYLTAQNFQPGQFVVMESRRGDIWVQVTYVEKETGTSSIEAKAYKRGQKDMREIMLESVRVRPISKGNKSYGAGA